jgi:hypothetical protein
MKDKFAITFFLLAYALSWGAWSLQILNGKAPNPASPTYLHFGLGGFGPSLVGFLLTAFTESRLGLAD